MNNENLKKEEQEISCSECPENKGCDSWQDRLPCGQWNCWQDLPDDTNDGVQSW